MTAPNLPAKRDVQRSFGNAAATYDKNAFLQREMVNRLFERLDYIKLEPRRVLDLGSGTGYVSEQCRVRFPKSDVIALDLAPEMLQFSKSRLPQTPVLARFLGRSYSRHFICGDAENLPIANDSIGAVISSATLQWCNPEKVTKEVARILKPTGLFMFTTFGPDTLKELRSAFRAVDNKPHINEFVDMHDLGDMLVAAGFADPVMDQETITLTYADLKSMMRELKAIGAHNVMPDRSRGLMGKTQWQRLTDAYENFRLDGRLPSSYEVVYGHAWKPEFSKRKSTDGQQAIGLDEFKRMVRKT